MLEKALDDGSTATRGSPRDSESLEDSDAEDFSPLETVGFNEDALEHAGRAEPRRGTRARNVPQFFGEVRTHLALTEGNYVEPKAVYEAKQADEWDQCYRAMNDEVKALHNKGRHTGQMGLHSEIGTQWSSRQIQSTLCGQRLQTSGRTGLL